MTESSKPLLQLNLGCGRIAPEGWVNVDRSLSLLVARVPRVREMLAGFRILRPEHLADWPTNIVRHDIRRGLSPWATMTVDAIYSSHAVSFLYLDEVEVLLREMLRVLRPGRPARLALPDVDQWIGDYLGGVRDPYRTAGERLNVRARGSLLRSPTVRELLRGALSPGGHKWWPFPDQTIDLFERAGFVDVQRRRYLDSAIPDVAQVETWTESFFVEGIAPG